MQKTIDLLSIGLSMVLTMACSHGSDRTPAAHANGTQAAPAHKARVPYGAPPATSLPAVMENADAITEIVRARCDRAHTCHEVGEGKDFQTRATCKKQLAYDVQRELQPKECPGVRKNELEKCVTELRAADCTKMLDSIELALTCKKAQLCTYEYD